MAETAGKSTPQHVNNLLQCLKQYRTYIVVHSVVVGLSVQNVHNYRFF